jgi:hypothetical protein
VAEEEKAIGSISHKITVKGLHLVYQQVVLEMEASRKVEEIQNVN